MFSHASVLLLVELINQNNRSLHVTPVAAVSNKINIKAQLRNVDEFHVGSAFFLSLDVYTGLVGRHLTSQKSPFRPDIGSLLLVKKSILCLPNT